PIEKYTDDVTGDDTIKVLRNSLQVLGRITGNGQGSLGLHPAVYFYTERARYNKFIFLAITALVQDKIRNNDSEFFKKFTKVRKKLEQFLMDNKSVIAVIVQQLSKAQRGSKMK